MCYIWPTAKVVELKTCRHKEQLFMPAITHVMSTQTTQSLHYTFCSSYNHPPSISIFSSGSRLRTPSRSTTVV